MGRAATSWTNRYLLIQLKWNEVQADYYLEFKILKLNRGIDKGHEALIKAMNINEKIDILIIDIFMNKQFRFFVFDRSFMQESI